MNKEILCDAEDLPIVSRFSWTIVRHYKVYYAYTTAYIGGKRVSLSMHRLVMGFRKAHIDHINHNGLDNRKQNLRYCNYSENQANSLRSNKYGFRGIDKINGKWISRIKKDKKRYHLGTFETKHEAARAYDRKAKELFGQFAEFNFPEHAYRELAGAKVTPSGFEEVE